MAALIADKRRLCVVQEKIRDPFKPCGQIRKSGDCRCCKLSRFRHNNLREQETEFRFVLNLRYFTEKVLTDTVLIVHRRTLRLLVYVLKITVSLSNLSFREREGTKTPPNIPPYV